MRTALVVLAAMVIVTVPVPANGGAFPGNFNPSATLDPSQVINPEGK